ncbi:hypothetical protein Tcan_06657 [Toxocara canis]|uniref:Uncharacterized protein n=1 Tax=Toxocara canis TaxID=6265 RepID=A0A0B2V736_TOXCA|nr:hypothetical protein Tcan_06657 [Toxocara canis]
MRSVSRIAALKDEASSAEDEDCEEDYTNGDKRKPKKKRTLKEVDDGKGERVSKHRKRCHGKLNGKGCRWSTNALSLVVPFGMLL